MRAVLSLVLAVLLAGGGAGAVALAANTEHWETDRVAAEALASARAAVSDARADALAERTHLAGLTAEGQELVSDARAFLALAPGWADAASLAALTAAVDALEQALAAELPPGVPVIDTRALALDDAASAEVDLTAMAADATTLAEGRAELIAAARGAVADLARAAASSGGASIAGMALTTEEQRDAARAQLASLADDVRSGGDVLAALREYTAAWVVLRDAQAAAQAAADAAAAAAAAEAATESPLAPGTSSRSLLQLDAGPRPTIIDNDHFSQYCEGYSSSESQPVITLPGGSTHIIDIAQPHRWALIESFGWWDFILSICV